METFETGSELQENARPAIQRVFVVLNPVAGLTKADEAKESIAHFCEEKGWDCDIHETAPDEDLRSLVKGELQKGADMIIAGGGDGTVSAVVSGMVNSRVPMGILPAGTGNALARDLGIPLNMDQALSLLGGDHEIRTLDIMETNASDYYVLNVSVGLSSMTMRSTRREEKRRFGMLAYVWRALGFMTQPNMQRFRVVVDGRTYQFAASEVMIANSKLLGMQVQLEGVEVNPNDGRFDLFIIRADSARDYVGVFSNFLRKRSPEEDPSLRYLPVDDRVEVYSEFPLPVQADGEVIGNTPVAVRLIPSALQVVVPPNGKK